MERCDLERDLEMLKEELEDIKRERYFMLEKTSVHIPGSLRCKYDAEIKRIELKIAEIESLLADA